MEDLLPYFERELLELRRLARAFHERYPGLGGRLRLGDDLSPDPQVEHLIQAVALNSARVAKRLDDSYPEFTEALLEALFPHYLRPFPSCAIVQATYRPVKAAGAAAALTLARGTELDSEPVEGVRCRFRTAYDITLAPLAIAAVRYEPLPRPPAGLSLPVQARSSLTMVIEGALPAGLAALRLYVDGEPSLCAALRDALFMHAVGAYTEVEPGRWVELGAVPLLPVGFAEHEALVPFDARSHAAYRVLLEYFAFPDKFNFIDIDLEVLRPHLPASCRRFSLHVMLAGSNHMLADLCAQHLRPGCSPAVNLFRKPGVPVAVTQHEADFGVLADAAHPAAYEVHTIHTVRMVRRSDQQDSITVFRPFYAWRHEQAGSTGPYWVARKDATLASLSPGHETRITLVDAGFAPMKAEKTSLSIELSCTNRDLPLRLPAGQSVLTPIQDADSCTVRLVRRPSPTRRQDSGLGRHWRLIAHLAMNQHMLAQHGLPALREMLSLYDLTRSAVSRRQIAGITALASRDTVAWQRYKHRASLVHGTELRLTVDEEAFAGSGLLLFAQVLDQFLALYVQVNSFIELVILSAQTEKELIRCKPRSGTLTLA